MKFYYLFSQIEIGKKFVNAGESYKIEEQDRQVLRDNGYSDHDIWDIASIASFFNMSNRMASAIDMRPNIEYHSLDR